MLTLHAEYITILKTFGRLFSKRIWEHVKILLIGAILSPAERTVTAALRVMGLSGEKHFENYHRVLNRAVWSSLEASHILLGLLISLTMSHSVYAGHFVRIPPYMAHRWHHHIWVIWPKFMQEGCIR
jgi:hypothetical protein